MSTAVRRDADYMGALARELQAIGVELDFGRFEDGKNGRAPWEVKGITPEAVKFFSTGHERKFSLKRDLEEKLGRAVPEKVIQDAMRQKRRAKDVAAKQQDSAPVYELWNQDAERFGVELADDRLVERLTARRHAVVVAPHEERRSEFFRRLYGEAGLTKDDAEFDGKAVAQGIARCAEGLSFTPDDRLHLELEVMGQLVTQRQANDPAGALYTTPKMLEVERIVADALAGKARTTGMAHPSRANVATALSALGVHPDAEQLAAIEAAASGRGLTIINGWAGSGKTTSLKAVVDAGRLVGRDGKPAYDQVIVVSTASLTAQGTGAKLHADHSCSIEAFVSRVGRDTIKPTDRSVVVVDEAAMTNTYANQRLLNALGPAQVILVGDPEQSQPIGPGGAFQAAVEAHGSVELTNVWRQTDHRDRDAFAQLRRGNAGALLDSLDARSRFHVAETAAERVDLALDFYRAYRESGRSATDVRIIMDSSNVVVDEANRHVQRYRRDHDEIAPVGIEVEARRDDRRWTLHSGDQVMFLEPTKCGRTYVANGTLGSVEHIDPEANRVTVRIDDDRLVTVDLQRSADRQPLGLGYAVHTLKFQGSEVPIVLSVPGGRGTTDKFTAYSTLTRCTEEAHVFADRETHGSNPRATLEGAWSTSPAKTTATSRTAVEVDHAVAEEAQRAGAPQEHDVAARRQAVYLDRAERIVGPAVATRIGQDDAYPALSKRLDDLRRHGADERAMFTQALQRRELDTARNPAAVLIHRLAEEIPATTRASEISLDSPNARQEHHLRLSQQRAAQAPEARTSIRGANEALAKALELRADQDQARGIELPASQRSSPEDALAAARAEQANRSVARQREAEQDRGHDLGFGIEL
ncbi:MAG: AAA family ATPase [Propionibacteriaceae bacterium]